MLQSTSIARSAHRVSLVLCGALALLVVAMSGQALAKDRNHDNIPDRWEKRHELSLKVNQAQRDQDADEMPNLGEYEGGTDPRDEDTDGDGVPDGEENAGEIASFTPGAEEGTGTLVINLYSGETLTGEVTERTMIAVLADAEDEPVTLAYPTGAGDQDAADLGPSAGGGSGRDVGQRDCPGATEGSVDDLLPGTVVHQVTLDVTANGKEFRRIEVEPASA